MTKLPDLDAMDRPLIVAVDFDGTISHYESWRGVGVYGDPYPEAVLGLRLLGLLGVQVIVWTCRNEDELIWDYCRRHSLPVHSVNQNVVGTDWVSPKVYADYYFDDRSVGWPGWVDAILFVLEEKPLLQSRLLHSPESYLLYNRLLEL